MPALLRAWLPEQRWFAGKGRGVREIRVVDAAELVPGDPMLWHAVVAVHYDGHPGPAEASAPAPVPVPGADGGGDGGAEYYQLLVGLRRLLPPRLTHAVIGVLPTGELEGWTAYDAAHDAELTGWFLDRCAGAPGVEIGLRNDAPEGSGTAALTVDPPPGGDDEIGPDDGTADTGTAPAAASDAGSDGGADDGSGLRFSRIAGAIIPRGLTSLVIGVEQSNTSLVFGDQAIMKLFRRLSPGVNPDLEVSLALAAAESERVAEPLAWMEGVVVGEPTTLAILHRFITSATDGWELAITSVRDLYAQPEVAPEQAGGDFAGESFRLGIATAEVHADLARTLPSAVAGPDLLPALADAMRGRLADAVAAVPPLRPYADGLRDAYDQLAARTEPVAVQRIHGDYHLGQVVRTTGGWVLLDFEGEPARPLGERRSLHSPVRDVAAMLRSFDYAARHLLADHRDPSELEERARDWAERNRDAFCEGYAKASGADPRDEPVLLRAFETDKAVYEVVYEAHNRPSWLPIPMAAVSRLAAGV